MRGKGAAIMTGFETAKLLGAEAVATIDGDGQHNPKDIKKLMAAIQTGYGCCAGTRVMNLKNAPPIRIIANFIGNFLPFYFIAVFGFKIAKEVCGHIVRRHIPQSILRMIVMNMIVKSIEKYHVTAFHTKEILIDVRYTEYSTNKVHKQTIKPYFKMVYRMFISSWKWNTIPHTNFNHDIALHLSWIDGLNSSEKKEINQFSNCFSTLLVWSLCFVISNTSYNCIWDFEKIGLEKNLDSLIHGVYHCIYVDLYKFLSIIEKDWNRITDNTHAQLRTIEIQR